MKIERLTDSQEVCVSCESERATKRIDDEYLCGSCADSILLKQVKKCVENVTHAVVTVKILPKSMLEKREAERVGKEKLSET